MHVLPLLAATALLAAVPATVAGPADARIIDSGHFTDSFGSDPFDCDGILAQSHTDVRVDFTLNQRGSGPFPYYREHVHGTGVTTNLDTGGTFTNIFSASTKDHTITDNGDGTITITDHASGSSRFYDQFGNFVLKDPGQVRFAFDIDLNDTPEDLTDDFEVEGSFRVVRPSTGNSDLSGRDFCADLASFTGAP